MARMNIVKRLEILESTMVGLPAMPEHFARVAEALREDAGLQEARSIIRYGSLNETLSERMDSRVKIEAAKRIAGRLTLVIERKKVEESG